MTNSTLAEVLKLPGVSDLPRLVRFHFGKALLAERDGFPELAAIELGRAVAEEDNAADTPDGKT
jgi:hypothetical protein